MTTVRSPATPGPELTITVSIASKADPFQTSLRNCESAPKNCRLTKNKIAFPPTTFQILSLGYTRRMMVCSALDQKLSTLLHMHEMAFYEWGAVPDEILNHRMKTVWTGIAAMLGHSRIQTVQQAWRRTSSFHGCVKSTIGQGSEGGPDLNLGHRLRPPDSVFAFDNSNGKLILRTL